MLKIQKAMRDQIVQFLGNLNVPVNSAQNFLSVIGALNDLEEIQIATEEKSKKK